MKKSGSQQLLAKQRLPRASVRLHGLGECLLLLGSGFLTAGAQIGLAGEEGSGKLAYNGVVYNEMKGALSDPESILYDELSAALAITLFINKLNKHATAVFSGQVPPAIEFLQPEKTFENTVDSLRDFIIALDKEKADHLRYKVVDDMVKIFITPYRTTISEKDLEFSQGDYNVEVVLAVGVQNESDLDRALESHGRILHDATVAAISLGEPTKLGGIEWNDASASSYGELLFQIADGLKSDKGALDEQIATAFLTGIVAATERFSNAKTTSKAMTIAAQLMSAGANQQLIATKLEDEQELPQPAPSEPTRANSNGDGAPIVEDKTPEKEAAKKDDAIGALSISHEPKGDVDEVAREVAAKQSDQALGRAKEELAKQTAEVAAEKQEDATEAAEQKLAEQLAATAPAIPPAVDIAADIPMAAPSSFRAGPCRCYTSTMWPSWSARPAMSSGAVWPVTAQSILFCTFLKNSWAASDLLS